MEARAFIERGRSFLYPLYEYVQCEMLDYSNDKKIVNYKKKRFWWKIECLL